MFKKSKIVSNNFEAFFLVSVIMLMLILALMIFNRILSGVAFTWNFIRLAPVFAIAKGYQLYHPFDSGIVTGHIYGPLAAFAYLPVTLFRSPVPAVIFGQFLSLCFTFLPVFLMLIHEFNKDSRKKVFSIIGFLFFCYMALIIPSLNYSLFNIHADAPALGLGAIACAILYYQKRTVNLSTLFIVAIFATLSFWAKQVMLPIFFAIALYILFTYGKAPFVRYLLCCLISNILAAFFFLIVFNPENIIYNLITIPMHHPWLGQPVTLYSKICLILFQLNVLMGECSYVLLFLFLSVLGFFLLRRSKGPETVRYIFSEHKWLLFILVALCMVPGAILGMLKVGGTVNAFSFVTYFLVAGCSLALVELISRLSLLKDQGPLKFVSSLIVVFLLVSMVLTCYSGNRVSYTAKSIQKALEYAKTHKGTIYFPGNPLLTLLSENEYYHFSYGVFDRELAGFPITNKHFREHIPEKIDSIAIYRHEAGEYGPYILKYLPEFSKETKIEELPDWVVYTRSK